MKRIFFLALVLSAFTAMGQSARRLEILFLGDNGHHKPMERLPSIMAALGDKGVNFTYTDQLEDLTLKKFDILMRNESWRMQVQIVQSFIPQTLSFEGQFHSEKKVFFLKYSAKI